MVLKHPRMNCLSHCFGGSEPQGLIQYCLCPLGPTCFLSEGIQGRKTKAKTLAFMPPCGQSWWTVSGSVRFVSSQHCGECSPAATGLTSFCVFSEFCVLSLPFPIYACPPGPFLSFCLSESFYYLLMGPRLTSNCGLSSCLSFPGAGAAGM